MTPEQEQMVASAFWLGCTIGGLATGIGSFIAIWSSERLCKTYRSLIKGYESDINRLVNRVKELEDRNDEGEGWKR